MTRPRPAATNRPTAPRRCLPVAMLALAALALPACVAQRLPQEQSQRADRIGPLQIHIHADTNVVTRPTGDPTATTRPADLPATTDRHDAMARNNTTTLTVHVSTQGSSTQGQSATGGSPGPVTNTPQVSVPVSVTPLP